MSQDQDDASKTEEPTQRKLEEAHRKGQVATSQEVKHFFMLLGTLVVVMLFLPSATSEMARLMGGHLGTLHQVPTDGGGLIRFFREVLIDLLLIMLLPLLVLVVMAIAGNMVQHRPVLSAERIKPQLNKISPLKGLKRQFSLRSLVEFVKGIAKITIVGVVATLVVLPYFSGLEQFAGVQVPTLMEKSWELAVVMLIAVVAVVAVIAAIDYSYQRFDFMKQQRMTKQEVKDEYKQSEGDPHVKAKLRQIRQERARQRMMAAVPSADVVVTNPTHFAVALTYNPEAMGAPRLVAKGADAVAFRIRAVAEENDVPIVENPPLARALYQAVEIDQEVPPDHYRAVAEVISYVYRLQGRHLPGAAP